MKKLIFVSGFMCFNFLGFSQEETKEKDKLHIDEIYILPSHNTQRLRVFPLENFRRLNPASEILQEGFAGHRPSIGSVSLSNPGISLLLGFNLKSNKIPAFRAPHFRLGITYFQQQSLWGSYYKSDFQRDFHSNNDKPGEAEHYYIDQMKTSIYEVTYISDNVLLDFSFVLRTKPERKLSMFTGIGAQGGIGFNARTKVVHTNKIHEHYHYEFFERDEIVLNESTTQIMQNGTNMIFIAYIPIGFNFHFGSLKPHWNRFHLSYELRPSFNLYMIPGIAAQNNLSIQHLAGIRYSLQQ
ncbi:MAG: hypothetical protein H0X62_03665 [Bacteroidetes bacterium]|nr:hypothetical protein [Bacteroidota bacterium]